MHLTGDKELPVLSVIVPSFNQVQFLEETLQSIIGQQYPKLELLVIDGGSSDGSLDIIKRYEKHLTYWVSEPDRGQSHAINKGLEKATGEWVAWINSDDCYLPGTLVSFFTKINHSQYDFLYGPTTSGATTASPLFVPYSGNNNRSLFHLLLFFMGNQYIIPSQSVFVRRSILQIAGMLRDDLHFVMDLEWYLRIFRATQKRFFYPYPISFFRVHPQSKTIAQKEAMRKEMWQVIFQYRNLPGPYQKWVLNKLIKHFEPFQKQYSLLSCHRDHLRIAWQYPLHYWFKMNWGVKWYIFRYGSISGAWSRLSPTWK